MPYFTYLFSPETFEAYTRSDRPLAGVRKNQEKIAQKLQQGDRLMCYVTKVGRCAGVLEVVSSAYEDATPRFMPANDPFVVRFKVKPLVWLPIEKCLPIKEPIVWGALSFTKSSTPASPVGWTGQFGGA